MSTSSLPILAGTAVVSCLVGVGIGTTFFGGGAGSSSTATQTSSEGIFIPTAQLTSNTPPQWKEGEARYIIVTKPGETVASLCEQVLKEQDHSKRMMIIYRIADILRPDEFPAVFDLLSKETSQFKQFTVSILLSRWAEIDPKAAWAKVETFPEHEKAQYAASVFSGWISHNENEAIAFLETLPEGNQKKQMRQTSLFRLVQKDPMKAIEMVRANPKLEQEHFWSMIVSQVSASDPRKAIEITLQIPEGERRDNAIQSLVSRWSQNHPEEALNWVKQLPKGDSQTKAMRSLMFGYSHRDPEKAAELLIKELPSNPELKDAVYSVASGLARNDPNKAIQWAEKLPAGDAQRQALSSALQQWATTEPEKALTYALAQPPSNNNSPVINVLSQWIRKDPTKGMEWVEKNVDTLTPRNLQSLVSSISYETPEKALDLASLLPSGEMQLNSISHPAERLTKKDRAAAEAYLNKLPEGPIKEKFTEGYISAIAEQAPKEAIQIANQLPAGQPKENALQRIASQWARQDAEAAADWAIANSSETSRDNTLRNIVSNWANEDSVKAANWVNSLPKGKTRDAVTQSLANSLTQTAPGSAADWASSIQDENARNNAMEQVGRSWLRTDPEAAKAWIEKSTLPDKRKEALLKKR